MSFNVNHSEDDPRERVRTFLTAFLTGAHSRDRQIIMEVDRL